jgi:hypothetical protein
VAVLPAIIILYMFLKVEEREGFDLLTGALMAAFGVLFFTLM